MKIEENEESTNKQRKGQIPPTLATNPFNRLLATIETDISTCTQCYPSIQLGLYNARPYITESVGIHLTCNFHVMPLAPFHNVAADCIA